ASGDCAWITRYTVRKYYAYANRDLSGTITALRAMARAEEPQTLQDKLDQITCPVLLLKGGAPHSGTITAEEEAVLRQNLVRFESRTIAGSGHFIFEEQPAAVTAALVGLAAIEMAGTAEQGATSCAQ
ncbi:MAG: pimeloyl-ACP methyl ester carboxylesterase, partial [Candidatus Krumholzibacteriia bacterium]